MEINKNIIRIITVLSFLFIFLMDIINVTNFINYSSHVDNTVSNIITFISILIGFISTIYVMMQQSQDSYVLKLLRDKNLSDTFNNSFRMLMYVGFIDVIILIFMNFLADNITAFKIISYISCPLTTYFLLSSNNLITTICKMIASEEKLKKLDKKVEKDDIIK